MTSSVIPRRRLTSAATLLFAAALTVGIAAPADAATAHAAGRLAPVAATASTGTTGWLRVGHFSADTKGVDVQISALSGGDVVYSLDDVTYGQVSKYLDMDQGSYVVAMRPSGARDSSKPVVSRAVTIKPGAATTIAAYGPNRHLKTAAFTDDLTTPASGDARIRLIQVSTKHPSVSVETSTGVAIADKTKTGTATGYASVPAGNWRLNAKGSGATASATVDLSNGSVNTLLVLDNAKGGVSLSSVVDSSSTGTQPKGGVQTGGGWLAMSGRAAAGSVAVPGDRDRLVVTSTERIPF